MRFYDVNKGAIKIDGVNIKEMRRSDLRKLFGMVLQDTWLFNGTIEENIAYGKENATHEEVVRACLLYTSDAADDLLCVDLGGRRIIKKKNI